MQSLVVKPADLASTFSLIARHDTQYFLRHELPEYLGTLAERPVRLARYFKGLRSGDYIPKSGYSLSETKYVYLTIGQFSGDQVDMGDLTFLEDAVGEEWRRKALTGDCLIVTRSGTVGVVHVFRVDPRDDVVYIPSHHLAVISLPEGFTQTDIEFLRLYLQSPFARAYFWAFASGKGQKEISNWSIRTIPIPQPADKAAITAEVLEAERDIQRLRDLVAARVVAKDSMLRSGVSKTE